jgi:hypothetical protein
MRVGVPDGVPQVSHVAPASGLRGAPLSAGGRTFSAVGSMSRHAADPRDSRHVGDLFPTLEEKLAAADAARDMLASPGWAVLQGLVEAEVATIDRTLDSGTPLESRADYAAGHGRRGGLRAPLQLIQALVSTAERELAAQRAKHEGAATAPAR